MQWLTGLLTGLRVPPPSTAPPALGPPLRLAARLWAAGGG